MLHSVQLRDKNPLADALPDLRENARMVRMIEQPTRIDQLDACVLRDIRRGQRQPGAS
ncbi:MAG: hypothetical protein IPM40_13540 [Gammaproteobacteria bacterium]|nr:hypothetical protein [Gammaproteobacteria bacterium]